MKHSEILNKVLGEISNFTGRKYEVLVAYFDDNSTVADITEDGRYLRIEVRTTHEGEGVDKEAQYENLCYMLHYNLILTGLQYPHE